jgi:hypothetical protein
MGRIVWSPEKGWHDGPMAVLRRNFRGDIVIVPVVKRGTVTIHRTYFLESDVYDGATPIGDTWTDEHDDLTAREAARLIRNEGLTFAATGNRWATDPDGSRIVDYATGRRVDTSAHLEGWPERVEAAIIAAVDAS